MKRFFIPLAVAILITIAGFSAYFWWNANSRAISSDQTPVRFVIPRGSSATKIAENLYEKGLIKNPLAFKFYVQLFGKQGSINAGQFSLSPSMNLLEILKTLQGGPLELWVTIPEGLRREEIVEIVISSLGKENEIEFWQEFMALSKDEEGYLFPDTYLFPPDVEASQVLGKLTQTFTQKIAGLEKSVLSSKYDLDQIVTMASIIERETITDEERPIVAGILWKRLETPGWLLQADATIQYAIASKECPGRNTSPLVCPQDVIGSIEWWPILTKEDLEIESAYNSYKYPNLPPTPIANPGLSSIKAAVEPENSDYWYYLHDSEGEIHYAETLSQHNANIEKYLAD